MQIDFMHNTLCKNTYIFLSLYVRDWRPIKKQCDKESVKYKVKNSFW